MLLKSQLDRRSFLQGLGGAAGAAALLPLIQACGSDEARILQFQLSWLPNAQAAGEYVAKAKGYYSDAGIDIELMTGGPEVNSISLVASGSIPVGVSFQANTILARAQGIPVQAFAATIQRAPLHYYSLKRYGVSSIADFAGKTFALPPDGEPFLRAMLEANGMSLDDVNIERGGGAAMLLEHQVDVIGAWNINIGAIAPVLAEDDVVAFSLYDNGLRQQSNLYVATEDTINKERNMLAGLLEASSRGWAYAAANQEEAIQILIDTSGAELNKQGEIDGLAATVGSIFDDYTKENGWGALDPLVWAEAVEKFDRYGMLENPVSSDEAINLTVLEAARDRSTSPDE